MTTATIRGARSAVEAELQGTDPGRHMAETMIEKAKQLELPRVLAFTYGPKFLVKLDIKVMEHSSLSHKACNDGRNCQKYQACDEIAVMWILATAAVETLSDFPMAKRP